MADNKLHLIPEVTKEQIYNPAMGNIVLNKAEFFYVKIKEYQEDEKLIKDLESKKKQAKESAIQKWEQHAKDGWNEKRLKENYNANMQGWQKMDKEFQALTSKYNDVNWCWQLVGKKLDYKNISHNQTFTKGIGEIKKTGKHSIKFPELLVGGGMAWLEAFHEKEGATGKIPNGIYVQAYGKPRILQIEWTDFEYEPITKSVGFMSKVILHIYTSDMYGQEVEINLLNKNVIFSNDELNISDVKVFKREVTVLKIKKIDIGKKGVSDQLNQTTHGSNKNTVESEQYIQKIEVQILVDASWEKFGSKLEIYPKIKSIQTETFFEDFTPKTIKVDAKSLILTATTEVSNKPVVVGQVETNVGTFHLCQYTGITLEYTKDKKTETLEIYKEDPGVSQNPNIEIGLILGSAPEKFSIKVNQESDTNECVYKGKPNDHGKNIFVFDKSRLPKNINITKHDAKSIEGTAHFDFDVDDLPKYFWLSKNNSSAMSQLPLMVSTCRHKHNIVLKAVPEIEWTINFFYNTPDPVWFGRSEPNYNIYTTETTAVRDNISLSDIKNKGDVVALADLKKEEIIHNSNTKEGKVKIATTANRYYGNAKSNFGLTVKATYDGGKSKELSFKFAEEYRKTLGIIKSVYDLVDEIAGARDARKASETLPPSLLGRKNMMSLSLLPPAPSVGVGWKYTNTNNRLGIELAARAKIAPLIGGELKMDVLALADKIPWCGKLVTALDLTTWLIEKISSDALTINYRIDLTFYANLALEEAFIKYSQAQEKGKRLDADLKISGTLGGKLELEMGVKLNLTQITAKPKIEFEAGIKGDCYFKITASPNTNHDNIIDWTIKYSGLIVTVYYKVKITSQKDNKVPKKINPFELFPSYTETPFSMKW